MSTGDESADDAQRDAASPRGRPRTRDAQATRLALLRAAQRRFGVLGYDRTTTRDIARDAGVNVALIRRYFGGKEGLFQAVISAAPELVANPDPFRGDLVDAFLAGLEPDAWPDLGHHPLRLLLRDSSADENIQTLRSRALRNGAARIIEWSGVEAGKPGSPRRRDAELRAELVGALFAGIIALRFMTPVEPLATAEADELRSALHSAVDALLSSR